MRLADIACAQVALVPKDRGSAVGQAANIGPSVVCAKGSAIKFREDRGVEVAIVEDHEIVEQRRIICMPYNVTIIIG